jgi:hypothetical protein
MPKSEIDYSNTIIYKITCKDTNVKDLYVGHTTNFVQRKHAHKQSCINDKSFNYKCKLYEVIRNNGGWQNWNMEIVNFFNCLDNYEARKKEQEYFISLNATLNSIEPMPVKKSREVILKNTIIKETFFCEKCNIKVNNLNLLETHKKTNKHIKNSIRENSPIFPKKYTCNHCNVICNKKSEWIRHISTKKHEINEKGEKNNVYECNCGKTYKERTGLWRHSKVCSNNFEKNEKIVIQDSSQNEIKILINLVLEVVKSNTELQKQSQELQKQNQELQKQIIDK